MTLDPIKNKFSLKINKTSLLLFVRSIEERFGVYLDSIMGFHRNFIWFTESQLDISKKLNVSIDKLDKKAFIRGNGMPSEREEKHRMTQGEFKKNNSPGGLNHRYALDDCISSFFNKWTTFKRDILKKEGMNDKQIPFLGYLKQIRDRITHSDENSSKKPIKSLQLTSGYSLPGFEAYEDIELSEKDLDAIVNELRVFMTENFILV